MRQFPLCGRKLKPLIPVPCSEEHKPVIREMDLEYFVTLDHDMSKEHYIAFAACVNHDRIYLNRLYPEQNPEFRMPMIRRGGYLYFTVQAWTAEVSVLAGAGTSERILDNTPYPSPIIQVMGRVVKIKIAYFYKLPVDIFQNVVLFN